MPNIGFGELMVIVVVLLLVFGPDRLPEIARSVGKFVRGFQAETSRALSDLKEGLEPVKAGVFDEPDPLGLGSFIDPDDAPGLAVPETDSSVVGDATTELPATPAPAATRRRASASRASSTPTKRRAATTKKSSRSKARPKRAAAIRSTAKRPAATKRATPKRATPKRAKARRR